MRLREWALVLAAATSLGLAACHRVASDNSGAAHGTPGSEAPVGTTGKGGTNAMGGPGSGLNGGMNPAPGQSTGVAEGTTNSTSKKSFGNR